MNRTRLLPLASLIAFLAPAGRAPAQPAQLPTLIVAPFSGDYTHIQYWQPAVGQGLAEMLVTEIAKLNKFQVLETTQLDVLKNEIRQGQDGWIALDEKVEKGGFAGADFMFSGKVTRFGSQEQKIGLGGFVPGNLGRLGVRQTTSDVRIDWRLVDVATRKIIKTGSAVGQQKGAGFDVGVNVRGSGGGIGFNNREFMDSALGKATVAALGQITGELGPLPLPESGRQKMRAAQNAAATAEVNTALQALRNTPGKVLAVAGKDAVIVSLGSKHGYKSGDKLNLYETVEIKDDKGAVVFTEEKLVGEVVLQSVQEERSKASYAGNLELKTGWVVKGK
jgi:curli biogenesis system outer membrane secretion channel CsgG